MGPLYVDSSFQMTPKKLSKSVRSGERRSLSIVSLRPIHLLIYTSSSKPQTSTHNVEVHRFAGTRYYAMEDHSRAYLEKQWSPQKLNRPSGIRNSNPDKILLKKIQTNNALVNQSCPKHSHFEVFRCVSPGSSKHFRVPNNNSYDGFT